MEDENNTLPMEPPLPTSRLVAPIPGVEDKFSGRSGFEHAIEEVRRASVSAYNALVTALDSVSRLESGTLLAAEPAKILIHQGRAQLAGELLSRAAQYEQRLENIQKRRNEAARINARASEGRQP